MKITYEGDYRYNSRPDIDTWRKLESSGWVIDWDEIIRWEGGFVTACRSGLSLARAVAEFEEITGIDTRWRGPQSKHEFYVTE